MKIGRNFEQCICCLVWQMQRPFFHFAFTKCTYSRSHYSTRTLFFRSARSKSQKREKNILGNRNKLPNPLFLYPFLTHLGHDKLKLILRFGNHMMKYSLALCLWFSTFVLFLFYMNSAIFNLFASKSVSHAKITISNKINERQ